MTANFNLDDVEWIGDQPEVFATSSILDRQFCRDCGTSIGYRYRVGRFSTVQFILIGTLDHPENLEGPRHYFGIEDHLEKWMILDDGLAKVRADESPHIREAFELSEQPPST